MYQNIKYHSEHCKEFKKDPCRKRLVPRKIKRLSDLSLSRVVKVADGINQNPTIDTLKKIAKARAIGVGNLIKK